ncbi:hypothetical protein PHSY_003726 [Pseudozyma hubeiensis SY62]|uniref:Asteroid domain-containing protein n=1 Tax=Pseudozyma hubeiensis (strain SY62) TaxID=1305764 RepID=R9P457_PSEHS|nr:hypothetical protein PHSY_003726 [Pseudozyma hubeiensis SY62]GAC96146.1 hypothetical protein PHSY_003726 [Pseudozyma hubeiensis SY62]
MGVKGLTSYVKQIQHAVSEQVTIPVKSATDAALSTSTASEPVPGPFVIDGWAWIYRAYIDHFAESVRGGDYIGYTLHARQFVKALRQARLEPIFVFDGPYLPLKIPTVLSRLGETAANNSAFMRSSSRLKPGFQVSMGAFPPLLYDCTLEALRQCNVQMVIEEIEADSAVAELADRMGGWAVSNDSDFFVLCARGSRCRGYVPIDTIEYLVQPKAQQVDSQSASLGSAAFEDDGFAQVGKSGRARGRKAGKSVAAIVAAAEPLSRPPANPEEGALSAIRFTSYSSPKLAAALGIPTSMLSLLAALVGNDYTASIQKRILDPALPFGPQRITFIANAIKTETLRMASTGNRTPALNLGSSGTATPSATRNGLGRTGSGWGALSARGGGSSAITSATATPVGDAMHPKLDEALAALALNDPVRFMVQRVTERILAGVATTTREAYVTSGAQKDLVDAIIDSVCTYSLLSDPDAIHRSTPGTEFFSDSHSSAARAEHRSGLKQYRAAYTEGFFDRTLVESLTQRFCINRMAPEDPDQKSIQSTHARDLRDWTFTTLFSSWGMDWARETLEEPLPVGGEDEDELAGAHAGAIPILAGPGPNKVNWDEEGDPEELIPVQTPPSSFGSSIYTDEDDQDDDEEDEVRSRPGSAAGLLDVDEQEEGRVKPPPAVMDYGRRGDRYVAEQRPILSLDALIARQRDEFGIEPPQVLRKYLRA